MPKLVVFFIKSVVLIFIFMSCTSALRQPVPIDNPKDAGPERDLSHPIIVVDSQFTDRELELIHKAARMWEEATHNRAHFIFYWYSDYVSREISPEITANQMIKVSSSSDYVFDLDIKIKSTVLGFVEHPNPNFYQVAIVTDRIFSDTQFKSVVAHELGHALGMNHLESAGALMYKNTGTTEECLTRADMEQFCGKYKCNIADVSYCR